MEEFIDIRSVVIPTEVREELRNMFLRSGFANESNGRYWLLPCATGTFVNSSESAPKCQKCPAGKFEYSITQFRKRPLYMNIDMRCWFSLSSVSFGF